MTGVQHIVLPVVTVTYTTSDGTAAAGLDYVAAAGTLVFGAGETSKSDPSIAVLTIVDDDHLLAECNSMPRLTSSQKLMVVPLLRSRVAAVRPAH